MMAYGYAIKLLLLVLGSKVVPSLSQRINPCLYNREDVLPCQAYAGSVTSPRANQYAVHATRFQRNRYGLPVCVIRKEGEIVEDIEDLGTPDVKFLFSPGAERSPNIEYVNQMLVEYNVQCQPGRKAFIQFDALDLEPQNCFDSQRMSYRCQDYIQINAGSGGVKEYCGNYLPRQPYIVGTGQFTIKLRTSFANSYSGFRMFVTCFNEESKGSDSCTESAGKSGTELIDLFTPEEHPQGPSPITLTSEERKTLDSLMKSLYSVALSQARRKITSWPPPSYSQNEPGDILDLSELNKRVLSPQPSPPPSMPEPQPLPDTIAKDPELISIDLPIVGGRPENLNAFRRKRKSIIRKLEVAVNLDSKVIKEAVKNKNACNPIVNSLTSSYLFIAQRLEPIKVETARREYLRELSDQNLQ